MKRKEKIADQLKEYFNENSYVRITRGKKNDFERISTGYIVDLSQDFILLKEVDEFSIIGYNIIPIKTIRKLRYNDNDKYSDFIYKSEFSETELISKDFEINISSFEDVFKDLKRLDKTIISECEKFKHGYFAIGNLNKVENNAVFINYFDAQGRLDEKSVEHKFKWVTKITFDDNYSKVFSKYIKQ